MVDRDEICRDHRSALQTTPAGREERFMRTVIAQIYDYSLVHRKR